MLTNYSAVQRNVEIMNRHMLASGNQARAVDTILFVARVGHSQFLLQPAVPWWMLAAYDTHLVVIATVLAALWVQLRLVRCCVRRCCCGGSRSVTVSSKAKTD